MREMWSGVFRHLVIVVYSSMQDLSGSAVPACSVLRTRPTRASKLAIT